MQSLNITTNIRLRVGIRFYATAGDLDPNFGNGGKVEGVSTMGAIPA